MNLKNHVAELETRVGRIEERLEGDKGQDLLDEFKKLADEFNKKNPPPPYIPVPYPVYPPYYPGLYYPGLYYPGKIIYTTYAGAGSSSIT